MRLHIGKAFNSLKLIDYLEEEEDILIKLAATDSLCSCMIKCSLKFIDLFRYCIVIHSCKFIYSTVATTEK